MSLHGAGRTPSACCRRREATTASRTGTRVAELPGLTTFATDPYWKHWNESAGPFVRRFARLLRETCERHGVRSQLWLPSFGLTKEEIPELEAAVAAAREEGIDDLWTWGYEACGFMTHLATPDSPLVWEAVSAALTGSPTLESRSARELVNLLNVEDATVSAAVARAGDELADAIEAIAARIAAGGRLVYVGAGTSGRLAALDAAEVGPTFGSPPGEVVAIVAGDGEDAEDDVERGDADVRTLAIGPKDAVVAVSASGSTPYTLAALEAARAAGALCVAVVGVADSALAAVAEHEVRVERRAGGRVRVDAAQGRDGAEARPQCHLDRDHDPARTDVRRSDGRRRAGECEAARARPHERRARKRQVGARRRRGARGGRG